MPVALLFHANGLDDVLYRIAISVGLAQGVLDAAVKYAKERRQFGKATAEFRGLLFMNHEIEADTHGEPPRCERGSWQECRWASHTPLSG
jgi:acyl-CoA dehydrogenase-like protein